MADFKFQPGDRAILQDDTRFPEPIEVEVLESRLTADGNAYKVQWQRGAQTSQTTVPETALTRSAGE